jgi:hypothetical protein
MKIKPLFFLFFFLSYPFWGYAEQEKERTYYNEILLGGGSSIKGFGETSQEVRTVDILWRHARIFNKKESGWLKGNHEFWIEVPFSFLISDSDDNDSNDIGMVGAHFLFAWVFPETRIGKPYFLIGGGPQYILANIDGVGSDLCGNYQMGLGIRISLPKEKSMNLEVRYHHISNLGFAEPNIPLNSVKFFFGMMLPF